MPVGGVAAGRLWSRRMDTHTIIVGGGLSGLYAARLLAGTDFLLLEARDRLGGRILPAGDAGFDLGPAWFWPDMQPRMAALVEELNLTAFAQHAQGDVLIEQFPGAPPQRFNGMGQMASSFRIAGGMGALIAALAPPENRLRLATQVTGAGLREDGVTLTMQSGETLTAARVIFALPPRLLEKTISFTPALPPNTRALWQATPTWMAPHAKFVAVYAQPFWRETNLSGTAQSALGPLMEIHDASAPNGRAALFGFLGVPAMQRQQIGEERLKALCLKQLARLFGAEATKPVATYLKDWTADGLTATAEDAAAGGHPEPARMPWIEAPWAARVVLAGSETGSGHPGYLEGALEAAADAVSAL